ncbi:hypoxanthine-guanine-xanthine phosphoribosyltransferase [Cyclospora cayetanensis]|uniref:Hypoxanthine-guanine-xanthine phosphoribosyltransferase n=1 Tax=Cyclospora cayetanensis TaxID=88456 RepID=A0A6P6RWL9_9EIME|nr:hypoxanthine-guanine-xanthine phosphoribosyltransferase [Cyclospora cayetanensis]
MGSLDLAARIDPAPAQIAANRAWPLPVRALKEKTKKASSAPIHIPDGHLYTAEDIVIPDNCAPYVKGVLVPGGVVADRVDKLAHDIRKHFKEGELHMVCILKGAHTFFGDLSVSIIRQQTALGEAKGVQLYQHFIHMSTYRNASATGEVKFLAEDLSCLKGKNVLVVDDVVETGNTLRYVSDWLAGMQPKSVHTACLVQIRSEGQLPSVDFVGFSGPREWLVGYGIDYNGLFREGPHVCVLSEDAKKALAV